MTPKQFKEKAPSFWACYIVNNDSSGMSDEDIAACDKWADALYTQGYSITLENDAESYFGTFNGMGHDLLDYTIYRTL